MLAITVLELARNDLEGLDRQLAAKVAQAPNFFSNAPLVLALDKLPPLERARFAAKAVPGQVEKAMPALPEPHGSWIQPLEQAWLSRYAR